MLKEKKILPSYGLGYGQGTPSRCGTEEALAAAQFRCSSNEQQTIFEKAFHSRMFPLLFQALPKHLPEHLIKGKSIILAIIKKYISDRSEI